MRIWIFESKRSQMRRYGARALTEQLVNIVAPVVIETAIETHLASPQKELRWFGEGMRTAYRKWKRQNW